MTLEAKSPALSGQSAIDSGKKGGEFVHDVLHRITDRFIAGPLARKQVISADAEDFRQLQENINGAPALAVLRSSLILCPNSIWLKYMSHPFRKRGRMDFHLRTKRLEQAVFPQCRANEKAPSKSNPWSGYGYPLTNRSGFVRRLVVFTVPEGILLRLLDLKSICVIQLLCISVFPGCIHISGIVLPCLAMISSSVWGS